MDDGNDEASVEIPSEDASAKKNPTDNDDLSDDGGGKQGLLSQPESEKNKKNKCCDVRGLNTL